MRAVTTARTSASYRRLSASARQAAETVEVIEVVEA